MSLFLLFAIEGEGGISDFPQDMYHSVLQAMALVSQSDSKDPQLNLNDPTFAAMECCHVPSA